MMRLPISAMCAIFMIMCDYNKLHIVNTINIFVGGSHQKLYLGWVDVYFKRKK